MGGFVLCGKSALQLPPRCLHATRPSILTRPLPFPLSSKMESTTFAQIVSASVAMQLEQIFDQLRQEHPLFWTVECERACTELILSAGDENALVNVSEAKEQIGLWFEGGGGEAGGYSFMPHER